jgi:D-alanyl-lipoteichoic acid acyltransferase DltB (MBOAT superfamily)
MPLVLLGTYAINRYIGHRAAIGWLLMSSLLFYGFGEPRLIVLIVFSMMVNYIFGRLLVKLTVLEKQHMKKYALFIGIFLNLFALGYFKYTNFFLNNLIAIFNLKVSLLQIVLPIGISFYTFTQIAYLVDCYRGNVTNKYNFTDYCLFVTFFPHLIAGPIVHHKDLIPQFQNKNIFTFHPENLGEGFTLFCIGLFKKTIIADGVAQYADLVFHYVGAGGHVTLIPAWLGSIAYTLQIYFDFSGYSDMAIGLARMFGIRLPINFNSPYKAANIIDFWRRWNMTLSRFLKEYLYFSLGGNRKGVSRRYINLLITMVLGGLWHGASWTFVFWGALHGVYLCINHGWLAVKNYFNISLQSKRAALINKFLAQLLTFICVTIAWVFFRAENFSDAAIIIKGMFGFNGFAIPKNYAAWIPSSMPVKYSDNISYLFKGTHELLFIIVLLGVVTLLPNAQQFINRRFYGIASDGTQLSIELANQQVKFYWALLFCLMFVLCLLFSVQPNAFIYFKF